MSPRLSLLALVAAVLICSSVSGQAAPRCEPAFLNCVNKQFIQLGLGSTLNSVFILLARSPVCTDAVEQAVLLVDQILPADKAGQVLDIISQCQSSQ